MSLLGFPLVWLMRFYFLLFYLVGGWHMIQHLRSDHLMQVYHYGKFDVSNDVEASFFRPKQEVNIFVDGARRQHNSRSVILF